MKTLRISTMGVAISTTGELHRLGFLETCVRAWKAFTPEGTPIIVTVDGGVDDVLDTREHLVQIPDIHIFQVGKTGEHDGRMGVAANKNTGLEILMTSTYAQHIFLCDEDTWPRSDGALTDHTTLGYGHSMVCWGANRKPTRREHYTEWEWPRGVMLYQTRDAVSRVGGMREEFGAGGHEHVEYSRRMHQCGVTPAPYISPRYHHNGSEHGPNTAASNSWHAVDMRLPGEPIHAIMARRRAITTIHRPAGADAANDALMARYDGDTAFVSFDSASNGRSSAIVFR